MFRSTGSNGASFNFPGHQVAAVNDTAGSGKALLDKQLMTVDNHPGSRYADRIYVTWTSFAADGTGYIYAAHSERLRPNVHSPGPGQPRQSPQCREHLQIADAAGQVQRKPVLPALHRPRRRPVRRLQQLQQRGHRRRQPQPGVPGPVHRRRRHASRAPVKVGDYYDLPDCDTYQGRRDPGRACVPEKGSSTNSVFRASNYPIGAVDPTDPNRVVVTYGSYINRNSNEASGCTPAGLAADGINTYTGVKTGGLQQQHPLQRLHQPRQTFSGTPSTPGSATGQPRARQADDRPVLAGGHLHPSRLAGSLLRPVLREGQHHRLLRHHPVRLARPGQFAHRRVTSTSMPPPTEFAGQFYGDYAGLAAPHHRLPIWSDTRAIDQFLCPGTGKPASRRRSAAALWVRPNAEYANDQDIYTAGVVIPNR